MLNINTTQIKSFNEAGESNTISKTVGQRIKSVRRCLGITQRELGSMIGLTFQQVQKYENGSNRISIDRLVEIANVLNTKVTIFLDELTDDKKTSIERELFSGNTVEIIKALRQIKSDTSRELILDMIKKMKSL